MLSLEEETRNRLLEMGQGTAGRIYLGAIETAGTVFLPDWIEGFQKRYPLVRYYIWTANSEDVVERLRHHLIDLALIRTKFDKEQYEGMPIGQERWIALISRDHPLARKKEKLSLEELSQESLIVPTTRSREIREWFEDAGLSANIFCEFSPLMNALVMAERNLGIAILPESVIVHFKMHPVVVRQLQKKVVTEVSLIWRKDNTLSGAEQKFVEYVREVKGNDENKISETNN
ncbi:LysR family transcriptional regulator substrate-binding protein [uncultured Acidaminococcus sp.]|uniref:LysR family transcriptional regulator substrate-binding protein n=1 Tax=uncultured Acidaminococcus sp. TaxID=352152 RepID=UPI00262B71D7|nr:LysR family transcriptional regulator substrate-binding protein [uncultured Acidaminococcus sp.]